MKKYLSGLLTAFRVFCIGMLISTSALAASDTDNSSRKKSLSKDRIELETLKIQGNKELPKVLFVVPWQNKRQKKGSKNEQRLVLHSLYGDLFDPVSSASVIENNE